MVRFSQLNEGLDVMAVRFAGKIFCRSEPLASPPCSPQVDSTEGNASRAGSRQAPSADATAADPSPSAVTPAASPVHVSSNPSAAPPSPPSSPPADRRSATTHEAVVGELDEQDLPAGGCDPVVRRLFAEVWDASVVQLRASDLLSNDEVTTLQYYRVPLPPAVCPSDEQPAATGRGAARRGSSPAVGLLDPPLYFATIVQRELDELSRLGAVHGGGGAIYGASLILRAICADLVGPGNARLVDDLWRQIRGLGVRRLQCDRAAAVCAAATRLCEILHELPPSSVDGAWRSWAVPRRASKSGQAKRTGSDGAVVAPSDDRDPREQPTSSPGSDDRSGSSHSGRVEGLGVGLADGETSSSGGHSCAGNRNANDNGHGADDGMELRFVSRPSSPCSPTTERRESERASVVRDAAVAALRAARELVHEVESLTRGGNDDDDAADDGGNEGDVGGAGVRASLGSTRLLLWKLHRVAESRESLMLLNYPGAEAEALNELLAASPALWQHARVLRLLLTPATWRARKPRCAEARRRLKSFVGSLQMCTPSGESTLANATAHSPQRYPAPDVARSIFNWQRDSYSYS